jgi:hypothetical protein
LDERKGSSSPLKKMEKYLSKHPQSCKIWKFDPTKNECIITLVGQASFIRVKDCVVLSHDLLDKLKSKNLMLEQVYAKIILGNWDPSMKTFVRSIILVSD